MPALVFSALLVDDDGRMTSTELTSSLEVSPASVSGAVKYLAQVGMLRRERERGSVVTCTSWTTTPGTAR